MTLPVTGPLPRPTSIEDAAKALASESIPNPGINTVTFTTREFTSVCPRTGQPDYCTVSITYQPRERGRCLESKSLKFYLWAFRDEGAFSETVAVRIRDDITRAINPLSIRVHVEQNARGGITLDAVATG